MKQFPRLLLAAFLGLLVLAAPGINGDVVTSSAEMLSVFQTEKQAVNLMADLLSKTESKLALIRKYLKDFESVIEENVVTEEDFEVKVAGNPIYAYQMMKRLTLDWKRIEDELKKDDWKNAIRQLDQVRTGGKFPEEEDFHGAAQALIRLQDTYELNMTELVSGKVQGRQTHGMLTAQDCLFMGKHSFNAGLYSRAVEWFEQSFILAGLERNQTVRQDQVMEFLDHAIKLHDQSLEHGNVKHTFSRPLRERPAAEQRSEQLKNRRYRLGKRISKDEDVVNFNALCRGEQLLDGKTLAKMKCWLDSKRHPYFVLMPLKIEKHNSQPDIYTFHDVISDSEIEVIKKYAKPALTRSMVQGKLGKGHEVSNVRTSKTAWLPDTLDPALPKISWRIGLMTGLLTDATKDEAELLQVANYGIGGHYNPHHDYLMKDKGQRELDLMPLTEKVKGDRIATFMFYYKNYMHHREVMAGDRIATFMFYLNDVERGGATAFPRAGVAVQPVKGSAAFWWNLKKSGKADTLTLHGACPVLLGHKWVSNKWIRETSQLFKRPCGLDMNE